MCDGLQVIFFEESLWLLSLLGVKSGKRATDWAVAEEVVKGDHSLAIT